VGIGTTSPQNLIHVNSSATPSTSQLRLTANGLGSLSALAYAPNNTSIGFDVDFTGSWIARSSSVAWLYKSDGWFKISGSSGNAVGSSAVGNDFLNINLSNGNVGIGTSSPSAKLDVENGTAFINTDVLAGLGGQVTISNGYGNQNGYVRLNLNNGGAVSWIKGIVTGPNTNTGSAMAFGVPTNTSDGTEAMRITSNGSLAIGTTDPLNYKLAVNGSAIAESITVKLHGSWPDFVFKAKYNLSSLADLKTYIDKNQHLPDMPSEAEVARNGINLGEMNKLLVKKVEELTLYLIEQQEKSKQQNTRIAALEKLLLSPKQPSKIFYNYTT
jgi:hypothetical protein